MAGERTKDITKINVRITPLSGGRSARTITNLANFNSGTSGPKVEKREPDTQGRVFLKITPDKSREPTLSVKIGTSDEKYLDDLEQNDIPFDMVVIDESQSNYKKQETGKECYIAESPEDDKREGDNRVYSIISSEYDVKPI